MSVGAYGTNISVNLGTDASSMVDLMYTYSETMSYDSGSSTKFKKLDSSLLTQALRENDTDTPDNIVEGIYNLQLPLNIFNKKGFYTVCIQPKEYLATIQAVGPLTYNDDVVGLVLNNNGGGTLANLLKTDGALVGYRLIYLDSSGKRRDEYRIVTSSNRVEPVSRPASSSSDNNGVTYSYNAAGSLTFLTLTPSSAPSFNSSAKPFIGSPNDRIILVNTMFEPIMIEIEMTTHDADTISWMLENSQLRDLDHGMVTTYNDNNEIYHQTEHYTLKDSNTGRPVYEVKKKRIGNIDFSETITDK